MGDTRYQWQPKLIYEDMVFATKLATISWIPANMFATGW
jgi:hypothetical protein